MIEFNATFLIAMLSFVVFIFIMNAIFYRPVLNIIRKRDNYIKDNYSQAKAYTKQAQDLADEYEEKLSAEKEKGRKIAAQTLDEAQKKSFAKTQEAKEISKEKIQTQKDALKSEKETLQNTVNTDVVSNIAASITSKIIGEEV